MKIKQLIVSLFFSLSLVSVYGQEEISFSDDEITKYATVMVWADQEKAKMSDSVEVWVKSNDKLSASAYNILSKATKKGTLETVEATDEEKAEFAIIQDNINSQKDAFKEVYVGKIKEDIGAGLYNKLKKDLRKNPETKERYDAIFNTLKEEKIGGDEFEAADSE